jgi:hypothetical protein
LYDGLALDGCGTKCDCVPDDDDDEDVVVEVDVVMKVRCCVERVVVDEVG